MDREALIGGIKQMANEVLPTLSAQVNMPVCRNHCFLRIAYDNAVGQKWDQVVAAPFLKHATLQQLSDASKVLRSITSHPESCHDLNNFSLRCRGHKGNSGN